LHRLLDARSLIFHGLGILPNSILVCIICVIVRGSVFSPHASDAAHYEEWACAQSDKSLRVYLGRVHSAEAAAREEGKAPIFTVSRVDTGLYYCVSTFICARDIQLCISTYKVGANCLENLAASPAEVAQILPASD